MSLPWMTSRSVSPGPRRVPDGRISMSSGTISPGCGLSSRRWARTGWWGGGLLLVEFALGGADPAQRDRPFGEHRVVGEADEVAVAVELLQGHEDIQVAGLGSRHPHAQFGVADQVGGRGETQVERGPATVPAGL